MRVMKVEALHFFLLVSFPFAVYGFFLNSPIFFDDQSFFYGRDFSSPQLTFDKALNLRWLPYASIEWTVLLLGDELVWLRLGNLVLHILNACFLLIFLRLLYQAVNAFNTDFPPRSAQLRETWTAFFAALIFALHPVATFGVAYLVQRSILLATLFALLTWLFFLKGLVTQRRTWLLASGVTYFLAGMSKEHAILVPLVGLAMLPLLRRLDRQTLALVWPVLVFYLLVAFFVVYQAKAGLYIGQTYEPYSDDVLSWLKISPDQAYPLSVVTQSFLFFKYLWFWLLPIPSALSITMGAEFARDYFFWPLSLGPLLLIAYIGVGVWMLRRGGDTGLLGFAMLAPALLFAVELATVRVQEIFVLYRSYLWMPCLAVALPVLVRHLTTRSAFAFLITLAVLFAGGALSRMAILADPVSLWREGLIQTEASPTRNSFTLVRAHHNLGQAYIEQEQYARALPHLNEAIRYGQNKAGLFNDRAIIFFKLKRYDEALVDYGRAIALEPYAPLYYFGRAEVFWKSGQVEEARRDYDYSCRLGRQEACVILASSGLLPSPGK